MGESVPNDESRVLAINPGSTSTKFGVFTHSGAEWTGDLAHPDHELDKFRGMSSLAQLEYRARPLAQALQNAGYALDRFAATAGRGGLLPPMECGTYCVDEAMVEELRRARRGDHACNLGAVLALKFARSGGVRAYVVDPPTVDEWQDCARLSGLPLVPRTSVGHALNTKAVARRFATEVGRDYASLRLIVVHMGSGITVSAHRMGKMIDNNSPQEGPFGPDRTGSLPVQKLIALCCSGTYNAKQLDRMAFGEGGLFAYLGTRDLRMVERRIAQGDAEAAAVHAAMVYQIAKEAGAMAAVLEGKVDAILLTGGMAFSERVVASLRAMLEWIAPIHVYPGEDELRALADGVFRVLDGTEVARRMPAPADARDGAGRKKLVIGLE
jgi:butyrate kinase